MTTATQEQLRLVPAAGDDVLLIMTPTGPGTTPARGSAIFLQGAGHVLNTNHNRTWVRWARTLADAGWTSVRLDYHGVGESAGVLRAMPLDRPFTAEAEAARAWLAEVGAPAPAFVAACYGGRIALRMAAGTATPTRLVLLAPPVGDAAGAGALFDDLAACADRGHAVLVVYGATEPYYEELCQARDALRPDPFDRRDGPRLVVLDRHVRGLPTLAVQASVAALIFDWLQGADGRDGG